MQIYLDKHSAIIGLHEKGFTEDFEIFGDKLLWVQQKIFLSENEFFITEYHRFINLSGNELIIFGVVTDGFCVKGILLNRNRTHAHATPAIINTKLKSLLPGIQIADSYPLPSALSY